MEESKSIPYGLRPQTKAAALRPHSMVLGGAKGAEPEPRSLLRLRKLVNCHKTTRTWPPHWSPDTTPYHLSVDFDEGVKVFLLG